MEKNKKSNNSYLDGLNYILIARKLLIIGFISLGLVILSILILFFFEKTKMQALLDKLSRQNVVLVTNTGLLKGKSISSYKEIAKQFSIIVFNSTLNYTTTDPIPVLDFMRIYATPEIFDKFRKALLYNKDQRFFAEDIYFSNIDTKVPIKIVTEIPNKKYLITIYGTQRKINKFNVKKYPIKLILELTVNFNTGIENLYGIVITKYILKKL